MDESERKTARRWYRVTRGRIVLFLLALEGILLLSERFRWTGFNELKGWTVLLAFVVLGAAMILLLTWFFACLLFRRRWQFGIRELLLLLVTAAVPCTWLGFELWEARKQREAMQVIKNLGAMPLRYHRFNIDLHEFGAGRVHLSCETGPGPAAWLGALLGDDFFDEVPAVIFARAPVPVTDADVRCLAELKSLRYVDFRRTSITDAALESLVGSPQLIGLELEGTRITDGGLKMVHRLSHLQWLGLKNTQVSDAGLRYLAGLNQLRGMDLRGTRVSDEGVKKLQEALPDCLSFLLAASAAAFLTLMVFAAYVVWRED